MLSIATSLVALCVLPKALAHGHLSWIAVNGDQYNGPQVDVPMTGGSAIRMVNSIDPVTDDSSSDLSCGNGAANETAQLLANVNAGDQFSTFWVSGDPTVPWPHNVGPIITYIADCGGDCTTFQSLNAEWYKIDQAGLAAGSDSVWVQANTFHSGLPYNFTFPSELATGQYLMRHEIIALHNAQTVNGAEHYPACIQLNVTGGSNGVKLSSLPSADEAKFPGGYNPNDPGLLINVYNPGLVYQFPGPPLAFGNSTSSGNSSSSGNNDDGGSSTGASTSSNSTTPAGNSSSSTSDSDNSGSGSGVGPGSSSNSTTSASMSNSTTPDTTSSTNSTSSSTGDDDDSDCDDSGPDDDDSGSSSGSDSGDDVVVVTVYDATTVYVAASAPTKAVSTSFVTSATATVTRPASGTPTLNAGSSFGAQGGGSYRRRSRIFGRRHFSS